MTMRSEFDQGLNEMQTLLAQMGEQVEKALADSMDALVKRDAAQAKRVVNEDLELNRLEERVMERGAKLIATQQPVAKDLRRILAGFKIAADLERMGDLSVDIAKTVLRLDGETLIKPLIDLPRMAAIARTMIRDSIRSYTEENVELAYKMAKDDDRVDALYGQMFRELSSLMVENPKWIGQATLLGFVGRYCERIADYATNIGESTVYIATGTRPDLNG